MFEYFYTYTFYMHRIDQNGKPIAEYAAVGKTRAQAKRRALKRFFTDFRVPWYKRCLYYATNIPCGVVDAKNFK